MKIWIVIGSLFLFTSCQAAEMSPEAYLQYIVKNKIDFIRNAASNGVNATLSYQPQDFLNAKELLWNDKGSKAELEVNESIQFLLTLESENLNINCITDLAADDNDRQQRIHYASFGLKDDLLVYTDTDTLRSVFTHYERTYGSSTANRFVIHFPAFDVRQDFEVMFSPRIVLSNQGKSKFLFSFNDNVFSSLPKLLVQ